jgi:hypothetical protein
MSFDEARDLNLDDEIVEADQIDPDDGGDPERPLTPEELNDLWIHDPNRYREWDDEDVARIFQEEK